MTSGSRLREEAVKRAQAAALNHEDDDDSLFEEPCTPVGKESHPLTSSTPPPSVNTPAAPPSSSSASVAREQWGRYGAGLTQSLEDKRQRSQYAVRVIAAEERVDLSSVAYTAYVISVQPRGDGQPFEIEHRYSEFSKLAGLVKREGVDLDASFPSKHWAGRMGNWTPSKAWAPESHDDLIASRTVQLDIWLVHLMERYNFVTETVRSAIDDFLLRPPRPPCDCPNDAPDVWRWNNPFSMTLGSSIRQAAQTVDYMTGSLLHRNDQSIPLDLLQAAKGLVFMTVAKAGLVVSGRVGTGLVIQRLAGGGGWSAPCAVGTVGMGWGALVGGDVTHYLVVLTTTKAVQDLVAGSSVSLGAELGVAVGPVGRGANSHLNTGDWTLHPAYAYAHSQGLFVGMSLEGSVISVRADVNAKFYARKIGPDELLRTPGPKAAEPLYRALEKALTVPIPKGGFRPSQLFAPSTTPCGSNMGFVDDPAPPLTVPSMSNDYRPEPATPNGDY